MKKGKSFRFDWNHTPVPTTKGKEPLSPEGKVMLVLFAFLVIFSVLGLILGKLTITQVLEAIGFGAGILFLIFCLVIGFSLWATREKK